MDVAMLDHAKVSDKSGSAGVVLQGRHENRDFQLVKGYIWKIGRSRKSDIVIDDHYASRHHAAIQRSETGEYSFIDMGSRNGSFVNNRRVSTPVLLRNGDHISIGGGRTILFFTHENDGKLTVAAESKREDSDLTEGRFSRRLLTVLVVDVRDFTKLSQQIDEAVLCQAIGTWFQRASQIMNRYDSWALKYIGDAVMAIWLHQDGTAEADARDILRILRAVAEFAATTATFQNRFALPFAMRFGAGINTGFASVGNIGTGSVTDFTAVGEAVNTAFRIEAATKEIGLEIALGNNSFSALRGCVAPERYFEQRSMQLKGYEAQSKVWAASLPSLRKFLRAEGVALSATNGGPTGPPAYSK